MRIASLDLLAFGHFRGTKLDFSRPGIHVVHGRNEAGKSTTLRAILGLLFGIETRTTDAHVHKTTELRIGGVLENGAGESLRIIRRKGNEKTLLDASGNVIDDVLLRKILGGVTRETFANAWGLDHDRLGAGARALLDGKGDLGESLFDASVGGGGDVQKLLKDLTDEADRLYKAKASAPPLNEALKSFADATRLVKERQSNPEAFLKQEQAVKDTDDERRRVIDERIALETKRKRLAVSRRRGPLERRRDTAKTRLAELASIVAVTERITAMRDRQAAYRLAVDQRRTHEAEITRLDDQIHAAARRAGISARVELEKLRLDARTDKRIKSLLDTRKTLSARIESAEIEIAKQERELARLGERVAPSIADATALVQARDAAQLLGDLEERLITARTKAERDGTSLASKAASAVFEGSLDALVALRLPAVATVEALAERATEIANRHARKTQRREDLERDAASITKQIASFSGDFAPPNAAALHAARTARDEAWAEFRNAPDAARAVDVDRRLHEVDSLADRMIREADRVTTLARLHSEAEENARQIAKALVEEEGTRAERIALDAEHRALYADAGIEPRAFSEMIAWLGRHAQTVEKHTGLREAKDAILDGEQRLARARADLRTALVCDARSDKLAELLAEVSARVKAIDQQRVEAEAAARRGADLRVSLDDRGAGRDRDATARSEAEAQLAELLAPLGVGGDASGEEVTAAIDALRELFTLVDSRAAAASHARAVTGEISEYESELTSVLGACALATAEELFGRAKDVATVQSELATVEAQLAEIQDASYEEVLEADEASQRDQEWEQRIDELTQEGNRLTEMLGGLRAGIEQLRGETDAADAAATAQQALARIRENAERWCRVRLAATVLGREIDRYREENQGPLLASTSSLFERLTLGAYTGVRAGFDDKDRPLLRCVRAGDIEVDVTGLSDGTRDQLYLSLRLASLLRRAQVAEPMPLVLDDVLIQLDDQRASAALSVLAEVARSMQVLFFTHHARLVDLAQRAVPADELVVHHLGAAPVEAVIVNPA